MKEFKKGDRYYYWVTTGEIVSVVWNDDDIDNMLVKTDYIFKTREEAEFIAEKIKVYNELKRYAEEHNEREIVRSAKKCNRDCISCNIKCEECGLSKYLIFYDVDRNRIGLTGTCTYKEIGQIYFSSKEIAENAINAVGEDRIKKYLFEVE